ncbi:MAG: hypothetical protein EAX90_07035 [Candidatus Heimdallarchaeota archaeon]|nr:hypothetical protein [Candidatus Heimdallarchaeota archaeon]
MIRIMKKSKILAAVLLLAMFSSLFSIATVITPAQTVIASAPESPVNNISSDAYNKALGNKAIFAENVTDFTAADLSIVFDGNVTEWTNVSQEIFDGVYVQIAFDKVAGEVYIALKWADATISKQIGNWIKTGDANQTEFPGKATWDYVAGAIDLVNLGFSDGTDKDTWIWTPAYNLTQNLKSHNVYMVDLDTNGELDAGNYVGLANSNETDPNFWINGTAFSYEPLYADLDYTTGLFADQTQYVDGTIFSGWYKGDEQATLASSQTDVEMWWMWNATGDECYSMEIVRDLDTGFGDDLVLDFSAPMTFYLGIEDGASSEGLLTSMKGYKLSIENEEATLNIDTIVNPVTESLLVTGNAYDDFVGYTLSINLDAWDDTYGPDTWDDVTITESTGNWSYLFQFNEDDMPLGDDWEILVEFDCMYTAPVVENYTISINDITPPSIEGIVDVATRYDGGVVPLEEDIVVITVGLADDYCANDDITAELYFWKGDDVALSTPMVQFAPATTTFVGNLTIEHVPGENATYYYFINAWDTNFNKATSDTYTFYSASTAETPGFGILIGLFGLAAVSIVLIIRKSKK